jgi:serine phosphatase RsbU (regulator of sigma subunit)
VENARLYTELRAVAQTLQASLLPDTLPSLPGWEAAAAYEPGQREAEVGGDFYDVFALHDGRHMFILGDVTGKGIGAAALTSLVRHTAKTVALFDPHPGAVLSLVNRVLRQQDTLAPVTMLCGVLGDGDVTLAVAGHPLPLLKRVGGRPERVGVPGLLLGAVDEYPRADEQTVRLRRGDTLICFTDGVTDTPGDDSRFGDHRLEDIVGSAPGDAGTLLETVSSALDHFQRGAVADDRAMLALRWLGLAAATPAAA